jgi:L-fuconate dehydratase
MIEYVDHLHEHFVVPVDVHDGRYWPPTAPGSGAELLDSSRHEYERDPSV